MEIPKSIEFYYKSPEKVKLISEQFVDYCQKNNRLAYAINQRIRSHAKCKRAAILVSGISGSTKTFFSELLASYGSDYTVLHLDCFAVPKHKRKDKSTFLHENFNFEASFASLDSLLVGKQTDFPLYCHEDQTFFSNLLYPSKSFVVDGIHSHNPLMTRYFENLGFETFKITLIASFKYLKSFKRGVASPPEEIIKRRIKEYQSGVYHFSEDSFIKLRVGLEHKLEYETLAGGRFK